jgi:hypothetical protein
MLENQENMIKLFVIISALLIKIRKNHPEKLKNLICIPLKKSRA